MDFNETINKLPEPYYRDWQSDIVIYNADCRDILPLIPDKSIDLVLTDPPYGIDYAAHPIVGKHKTHSNHKAMSWDSSPINYVTDLLSLSNQQIIWGGNYYNLPSTKSWLIWYKRDAPPSIGDAELAWSNLGINTQVFDFPIAAENAERVGHATQKPLALFCWCINFANGSNVILDPFLGSGTTAVACKKLGRKCIGIEIEQKYCDIAVKRLAQGVLL